MKENDAVWLGEKDRQCLGSGRHAVGGLYCSGPDAYRTCPNCGVQLPVKDGELMWSHSVPRILAKRPKGKA